MLCNGRCAYLLLLLGLYPMDDDDDDDDDDSGENGKGSSLVLLDRLDWW